MAAETQAISTSKGSSKGSSTSRVTLSEVARRADVSIGTASLVMSGKAKAHFIVDSKILRVQSAAADLGYQPNDLARAIVSGKNRMIGFLGFNADFESAAPMLESALDEAEAQGYTLKVLRKKDNVLDASTIDRCLRLRLAGVIALFPGPQNLDALRDAMERNDIPVALLDNSAPHAWASRIISDDIEGIDLAVRHLAELGHRRIAHITGFTYAPVSIERAAAFRATMADIRLPLPEEYVVFATDEWNYDAYADATLALFSRGADAPTAVIASTDQIAAVVLQALHGMGLRIPADVSVVGFADIPLAKFCYPPLTTVAQPFAAMGHAAVRHILTRIPKGRDDDREPPVEERLRTHLVVRKSTGPAPTKS